MMNREELKNYLAAQVEEIQKYKWIESERAQHDIGFERAALEWISRYSDVFRHYWFGGMRPEINKTPTGANHC